MSENPLTYDVLMWSCLAAVIGLFAGAWWWRGERHALPGQIDLPPEPDNEPGLRIRPFDGSVSDILAIRSIIVSQWGDGPTASEEMLREWLCEVEDCGALVAEQDGSIVGFVLFDEAGADRQITILMVHERYQRNGVATALVLELRRAFVTRRRCVWCNVPAHNAAMLGLLKELGFRETKDYGGPLDFRRMEWRPDPRAMDYLPPAAVRDLAERVYRARANGN